MESDDGRARRTEETRHALLTAAKAAFARHGFKGASIRDISAAARTHPALVTYHFGTKAKLYDAVIDSVMQALQERLIAAAMRAENPADIAWNLIEAYEDYLATERELPRIVLRALMESEGRATRKLQARLGPMVEVLRERMLTFESPQRERMADAVITLFSAVVVPSLYQPLLETVYGEPLDSPSARSRRRAHLKRLLAAMVNDIYAV